MNDTLSFLPMNYFQPSHAHHILRGLTTVSFVARVIRLGLYVGPTATNDIKQIRQDKSSVTIMAPGKRYKAVIVEVRN